MARVRIEWVPVQLYGLGKLGIDHLQLVLEPGEAQSTPQDEWFVIEGVRDATEAGIFLGIEGSDGRLTLSEANLAARELLVEKIGTPAERGSRTLPYGTDAFRAWETMTSFAREIEEEDFPYIAFSLPGSPTPTVNSSSAVASLIHYSGLDPRRQLPYGLHFSPGMETLLGTRADDHMQSADGFTTLLGGRGNDVLEGSADSARVEKLYGGEGDDIFRWSPGFNIVHGGQPQLPYAADGTDVIDYSGAGEIRISFNRHWVPHKVPNFVATFDAGIDHLFSVERIQWNAATDRIVLGKGINLLEDERVLQPSALSPAPKCCVAGLVGAAASGEQHIGGNGSDVIEAGAGDDTLYGGPGSDWLSGGAGSDGYVYLPGDGHDVVIDGEGPNDIDELVLAGGIAPGEIGLLRIADDLLLTLPEGSLMVRGQFAGGGAGIERIVFDFAPPLTRADIDWLARELPSIGVAIDFSGIAAVAILDLVAAGSADDAVFGDGPAVGIDLMLNMPGAF